MSQKNIIFFETSLPTRHPPIASKTFEVVLNNRFNQAPQDAAINSIPPQKINS